MKLATCYIKQTSNGVKKKNKKTIPAGFQPILWSKNVKKLDLEQDKNYIIHQILMYGNLVEIKWLFQTYRKEEIKEVFLKNPLPIYTRPIFYFIKNIILNLKEKKLDERKYIKNIIGPLKQRKERRSI